MKKIILLFACILSVSSSFSQSGSFKITFLGEDQITNNPVALQQVDVINLTRSVDTILTISPFIFTLDYYLSIKEPTPENKTNFILHPVYPNAFNNQAAFGIELSEPSNLMMSLYNVNGKRLASLERNCGSGTNYFTINTSENGLLFLSVSDGQNYRTLKLINMSTSSDASSEIVYSAGNANDKIYKATRSSKPFIYFLGDKLQYIGYASGYANDTIYDSPTGNETDTFKFAVPYYRIADCNITTASPCFVNLLFLVENQDYKGVDYLNNNNFNILEDGTAVGSSESFRYIMRLNSVPYTLKTLIMIDNSASVSANLPQIKTAAIAMVSGIAAHQEFAIYCFSDQLTLLQNFTNNISLLTTAINSITPGMASTNLYGAYIQGVQSWNDVFSTDSIVKGFLVLYTDGDDNQGAYTLQQAVAARGTKQVITVGLGNGVNPTHLNALANPGPYYPVTSISQLAQVLQQVQQDIYQYSNSLYWLNYMTPKRTGMHTLTLEVIGNQNPGSDSCYQGQFDADGFVSVKSGVYLNTTPSLLYGIDSVQINNSQPYVLNAVTYWANQTPSYTWNSSNTNIVTVTPDSMYYNHAIMNFPKFENGVSLVTVNDTVNSYTKTIKVIIYTPPVVSTSQISDSSATTATGGGDVTGNGGLPVTARGICWSTSQSPTTSNSHTSDGTGTGSFTSNITGLNHNTTYYVRAYATNSAGTSYGNVVSFTTPKGIPTVITNTSTNIAPTSATSGGNVTNDEGSTITARGVCWSKSHNPTISDSFTSDSSGTGKFVSRITKLTLGVTYFIRAYATNSLGTSYGNQDSFTTICSIGDTFQGGVIAYILQPWDPGYDSNVTHGLIAAPYDKGGYWCFPTISGGGVYPCYIITGASGTALGTGKSNTNTIISAEGGFGITAAALCQGLTLGGYSDWYLPSKDELNKLYLNQAAIGGFANNFYWSSSEANAHDAWYQYFANGKQGYIDKSSTSYYVRAIRAF